MDRAVPAAPARLRAIAEALRAGPWRWAGRLPKPAAVGIALALTVAVVAGDHATGSDIVCTLLYLAPIGFATWFAGLRAGVSVAVLSAAGQLWSDVDTRLVPLRPAVDVWNFVAQFGLFVTVAGILHAFRSRLVFEQQLARTDAVTGIANRRAFLEMAQLELERARRHGRPITLVYADADDFKRVNDELGHESGDALLAVIGATLRNGTRAVDAVARLGGDEFGVLLPETDGPTAEALLERLRATLDAEVRAGGWRIGLSYGVATFLFPPRSVDQLMARADRLMYAAKRSGKNGVRFEVVGGPLVRAVDAG